MAQKLILIPIDYLTKHAEDSAMKPITPFLLITALTCSGLASAAEIVAEETDTAIGKMTGGWAGVLVGGATGGPIGAVLGGLIGAWSGGEAQEATGLGGNAYRVKHEDSRETLVRAPNSEWAIGDQAAVVGNRLVPVNQP
jgi:hypothetical protein